MILRKFRLTWFVLAKITIFFRWSSNRNIPTTLSSGTTNLRQGGCGQQLRQVSISQTFYEQLFCAIEFCTAYMYVQFRFVIFCQRKFAQKLLVKCWWNCLQGSLYHRQGFDREYDWQVMGSNLWVYFYLTLIDLSLLVILSLRLQSREERPLWECPL